MTKNIVKNNGSEIRRRYAAYELATDYPDDIVEWVRQIRVIRGRPFSFEGREHLVQIMRDKRKDKRIRKGRQTEITEYLLNWLLFKLSKHPGTVGFYCTDIQPHAHIFSNLRLRTFGIEASPKLEQLVPLSKHTTMHQELANGSHLYMDSGWRDFAAVRSVPVDFLAIDEAQSQNIATIGNAKESMSKSPHKESVTVGTGSIEEDSWDEYWKHGDRQHWDKKAQTWIAQEPENANIASFWLNQEDMPWITQAELDQKKIDYSEMQYSNEVRGESYKGMLKPLTEDDIRACFDYSLPIVRGDDVDLRNGDIYTGHDWGGSRRAYTVHTAIQCIDDDAPMFRVLNVVKETDRDDHLQTEHAINFINEYEPKQSVMDGGGDSGQVQDIEKEFGEGVIKCLFGSHPAKKVIDDLDTLNMLKVDRTWAVDQIIGLITKGPKPRWILPGQNTDIDWVIDHYTKMERDYFTNAAGQKMVRYALQSGHNNDAFMSGFYAYLAWFAKHNLTIDAGVASGAFT